MSLLKRLLARVNGVNYLDGGAALELAGEHVGDSGIVVCFRYPPRAAFGMAPVPEWEEVEVSIDGSPRLVGGWIEAAPEWLATGPGDHQIEIRSRSDGRVLAASSAAVGPRRPVIVDVFPARRHYGVLRRSSNLTVRPSPDH